MTTLPQTSPMRLPRPTSSHLSIPSSNGHAVPALGQPASVNSLSGADVWRVIRSNLWLIVGLFVLAGVGGYFVNWWLAAHYARFTSTGLIRVQLQMELPQVGPEHALLASDPSPQSIEVEQQTQSAGILSRAFLDSILSDPQSEIRQTGWFRSFGSHIEDAKEDLLDKLDVAPRQNTRLISVAMSCTDPRDAAKIVREICQRHIDQRKQKVQDIQMQKSTQLNSLIDMYSREQANYRATLERLARQLASQGYNGNEGPSPLDLQLSQLIVEQVKGQKDLSEARLKLEAFRKEVSQGLTPKELQEAMGSSEALLRQMMDEYQSRLPALLVKYSPSNPQVKALQAQIDELQQQLEDREGTNRAKATAAVEQELQARLDAATESLKQIDKKIDAITKEQTNLSATALEYRQTRDRERIASEMLAKTETQRDELSLNIQQPDWSTAEWFQHPDVPDKPSFPKLWITLTMALSLGLILGLGIAFLREFLDTSVRSPRDIAKVGQLNLLGLIPHEADDPESQGARLPLAIYEAPHSVIAEQFRQVRTRLQHSASLDTVRSLLVTGTSPGDGKTTVACNLAAGLALNGRRILLVDANFRRPQIHSIFNVPNDIGFGDVLNSLDVFDQAVRETEVPNLSLLTSGHRPSNSTELLESQLLIDFIERALEEYDHVIFDTGPLLLVSETAALAPRVDGVVTVVRARGNSRGLLQRLRDQLRQLKAEHLGVILNAVRSQSGGYYAPMIKTYYAYQNS